MGQPELIAVIAELLEGRIRPVTDELAVLAAAIAERRPAEIRVVVLGEEPGRAAAEAARRTGLDVTAVRIPGLTGYNGEAYKDVLCRLFSQWRPAFVLAAHSSCGLDFAPGLAARLGAACITGVVGLAGEKGEIAFSRMACGGKLVEDVAADTPTQVICLQPGSRKIPGDMGSAPGAVEVLTLESRGHKTAFLGMVGRTPTSSALSEAKVIVAAGRGIGSAENLVWIERLAGLFPNSAVGGSRVVCDLNWLDYRQQVGTTGATVAPDLYIACGISGAFQHVCGMQGAGFVVAINTDPTAPIFNVSDVCIAEDLRTFIPLLIETYERQVRQDGLPR